MNRIEWSNFAFTRNGLTGIFMQTANVAESKAKRDCAGFLLNTVLRERSTTA